MPFLRVAYSWVIDVGALGAFIAGRYLKRKKKCEKGRCEKGAKQSGEEG